MDESQPGSLCSSGYFEVGNFNALPGRGGGGEIYGVVFSVFSLINFLTKKGADRSAYAQRSFFPAR